VRRASQVTAGLLHNAAQALLNLVDAGIKLLVVVDDAQPLDSASATLVHQLATQARCSLNRGQMPEAQPRAFSV
jgi:hypothetical protein